MTRNPSDHLADHLEGGGIRSTLANIIERVRWGKKGSRKVQPVQHTNVQTFSKPSASPSAPKQARAPTSTRASASRQTSASASRQTSASVGKRTSAGKRASAGTNNNSVQSRTNITDLNRTALALIKNHLPTLADKANMRTAIRNVPGSRVPFLQFALESLHSFATNVYSVMRPYDSAVKLIMREGAVYTLDGTKTNTGNQMVIYTSDNFYFVEMNMERDLEHSRTQLEIKFDWNGHIIQATIHKLMNDRESRRNVTTEELSKVLQKNIELRRTLELFVMGKFKMSVKGYEHQKPSYHRMILEPLYDHKDRLQLLNKSVTRISQEPLPNARLPLGKLMHAFAVKIHQLQVKSNLPSCANNLRACQIGVNMKAFEHDKSTYGREKIVFSTHSWGYTVTILMYHDYFIKTKLEFDWQGNLLIAKQRMKGNHVKDEDDVLNYDDDLMINITLDVPLLVRQHAMLWYIVQRFNNGKFEFDPYMIYNGIMRRDLGTFVDLHIRKVNGSERK